ncbi:MAG: TatD family hydrolase [Gammaproteobacteria bacterium]
MSVTLVDSHCHLPLVATAERDVARIVGDAAASGVTHMLCVAVDFESLHGVLAAAEAHAGVFASVGAHPNTERDLHEEPTVTRLTSAAEHPKVVAIGETGLDYYRSEGDVSWQHARFRTHIRAARDCGRPLVIHTRDSAGDVLRILREERADEVGGVMHCFVEDWDTASAALDLGFYISFSGIVTFKSAVALQDVARRVPAERVLVETDAPWLAPVPHRGKPNEPAFVRHTAEFLAGLREVSLADFADTTTRNFFRLFRAAHPH